MSTKRVLLTGGSGFIGCTLAPGLSALGHDVLAPRHAELDLTDSEAVRSYLSAHRPDVIVHGATKPGHRNAADVSAIVEVNERMFFNLVRDRDLCPRMIFLGSGAAYDAGHATSVMPEAHFGGHVPADDHGFSKYVIAKYIEQTAHITELRLFGVFGPHEDYAIRFISNAICKVLFNLPVTIRQNREFSYLWAADLVPVVAHFFDQAGAYRAYNVVPDEIVTLDAMARMVVDVSASDVPVIVGEPGYGLPYSGDNSRLHREMPDLSFTPMRDAVTQLHDWYRDRRASIDVGKLLIDR